jgi:hypothetical protein
MEMRVRIFLVTLAIAVLAAGVAAADGADRAYWVWHRAQPLSVEESTALARQKVRTLFWSVGELENREGKWKWKAPALAPAALAPDFHVVPVVRITVTETPPFSREALPALTEILQDLAGARGELQLDYDCPDRLLAQYAAALATIRRTVPRISITALTHWPRLRDFAALTAGAAEISPMFYDMQRDPTGVSAEAPPPPLLDPTQTAAALREWSACPIPWRAGLPAFSRLTVFDRTGLSRGQIRNWSWDDLCFQKSLRTLAPTQLGVTLLRADAAARVASTPLAPGEIVAARETDRTALAQTIAAAQMAGAAGVVIFRLPDGSDPAGHSLSDLENLDAPSQPKLTLRRGEAERLVLANESPFDLAPRLAGAKGDRDRGYALELDADAPIFREASAGDFWRMTSHANPDTEKVSPVAVPLATRLTFWFSDLRAGAALQTGLLQLAPRATLADVRYRILNCEGATTWKPLTRSEPSP